MSTKSIRFEPELMKRVEAHARQLSSASGLSVSFSDATRLLVRAALDDARKERASNG